MDTKITNPKGERLDYAFAAGVGSDTRPDWIIVLGHGVTGNMDRPVIADTAEALNQAGFDTLRFSFAGNGDSEGDFRAATISKELEDLDVVLDVVAKTYSKIAYIGHSMGGAVGLLQASRDDRLRALVSLAGMVDTKAFAEAEFGEETPDAGLMWDEEDCPLSSAFMKDLCETIGSVEPQANAVTCPWLLVHGTADDVVLPKDAERIQALRGSAVDVVMIEDADHSFNEPAHKARMTAAVVAWLKTQASN